MNDHSERAHSKYGPSGIHRVFACPGSVRLSAVAPPRPPNIHALNGTAAHEMLERAFKGTATEADKASDAWPHVQIAVEYVNEIIVENDGDVEIVLETQFEIPSEAAPGQVFGTTDICIYAAKRRKLWIIDYKHGVEVVNVS